MRIQRRARNRDGTLIPMMTLANMRANGTHSVDVECSACHHEATLNVDHLDKAVPVPMSRS
jgi:hypothetical protein